MGPCGWLEGSKRSELLPCSSQLVLHNKAPQNSDVEVLLLLLSCFSRV